MPTMFGIRLPQAGTSYAGADTRPRAGEGPLLRQRVDEGWLTRSVPSCRRRNVRRGLVVGDDEIVAATVLQPPLAADERRLGDVFRREWRQLGAIPGDRPDQRVSLVAAIASATLSPLDGSPARFITSTASSNSAWTKPIGWVQGRPVALVKAARDIAPDVSPVSDDLNGWLGDHQTSDDRLWPASPSASTDLREQDRLADRGDLRLEALLLGLVPEGGEVRRDHHAGDDFAFAALNALICAEKSSVRFW